MWYLHEFLECNRCGFYDADTGCTCYAMDKWYACPIESEKPENKKMLENYIEWAMRNEK